MRASEALAAWERGWERVADGYYANGAWRIQRTSRGWRWWFVVQMDPSYPKGQSRTLKQAKQDVFFEIVGIDARNEPTEAP